jgi:hypothetical protein
VIWLAAVLGGAALVLLFLAWRTVQVADQVGSGDAMSSYATGVAIANRALGLTGGALVLLLAGIGVLLHVFL